jgi:hypothetical protein
MRLIVDLIGARVRAVPSGADVFEARRRNPHSTPTRMMRSGASPARRGGVQSGDGPAERAGSRYAQNES